MVSALIFSTIYGRRINIYINCKQSQVRAYTRNSPTSRSRLAQSELTIAAARSRIGLSFPVLEECKRGLVPYCPINELATEHSGPVWERCLLGRQREQRPRRVWTVWASRGERSVIHHNDKTEITWRYTLKIFLIFSHWFYTLPLCFFFVLEEDRERGFTAANPFPHPDLGITMKNVGDTFFWTNPGITVGSERETKTAGKRDLSLWTLCV